MFKKKVVKRNVIPDDEKNELKRKIVEMRLAGMSNYPIAKELNISWQTAEKYYQEALTEAGDGIDPVTLLRQERMRTERMADKAVRDYYGGKIKPSEAIAMLQFANKYNRLDAYLETEKPEKLPDLLTLEVKNILVELPPEAT